MNIHENECLQAIWPTGDGERGTYRNQPWDTCDKYGELFCWFLHVIYFVVILMNKHKFIYSFTIHLFQSWLNMWKTDYNMAFSIYYRSWYHPSTHISPRLSPWADMEVSRWYQDRNGNGHVIIYIYCIISHIKICL